MAVTCEKRLRSAFPTHSVISSSHMFYNLLIFYKMFDETKERYLPTVGVLPTLYGGQHAPNLGKQTLVPAQKLSRRRKYCRVQTTTVLLSSEK